MDDFRGSYRDEGGNKIIPPPKDMRDLLRDLLAALAPLLVGIYTVFIWGSATLAVGWMALQIIDRIGGVFGLFIALSVSGIVMMAGATAASVIIRAKREDKDETQDQIGL